MEDQNENNDENNSSALFQFSETKSSLSSISDIGNWLISIPRDDVLALQSTPEYCKFLKAFEGLGHAHRRTIIHRSPKANYSFLQHLAVDDVILRVFEFLECAALVRTSQTCHRFRDLAVQSASQRTQDMENSRVLNSSMKMLRAKEQMEGVAPWNGPFVRVPILSLPRRIIVSQAGDEEYNGVYFCTGSNGNGFMFAKPRNVRLRSGAGRMLNCVISKRYSNETILWYMSKELENNTDNSNNDSNNTSHNNNNDDDDGNQGESETLQFFSFWAKLMVRDEASLDICRYPSLTSILSRNDQPAWQSLTSTIAFHPPVVELLD